VKVEGGEEEEEVEELIVGYQYDGCSMIQPLYWLL